MTKVLTDRLPEDLRDLLNGEALEAKGGGTFVLVTRPRPMRRCWRPRDPRTRLPRLIGKSRALDLMITGRTVSPDEALALGLVDRVLPADSLLAKTQEYAEALARSATLTIGLIKLTVNRGLEMALDDGLAYEREALFRSFQTEDAKEGVEAFVGKRPPVFKGA